MPQLDLTLWLMKLLFKWAALMYMKMTINMASFPPLLTSAPHYVPPYLTSIKWPWQVY